VEKRPETNCDSCKTCGSHKYTRSCVMRKRGVMRIFRPPTVFHPPVVSHSLGNLHKGNTRRKVNAHERHTQGFYIHSCFSFNTSLSEEVYGIVENKLYKI